MNLCGYLVGLMNVQCPRTTSRSELVEAILESSLSFPDDARRGCPSTPKTYGRKRQASILICPNL